MDWVLVQIQQMDIATILVICVLFWIFKSHLDKKFDKIDQRFEKVDQRFEKVDQRFEKVDQRFEKIEDKLNDLNNRLSRLEGAFSNKDCCMIKDHRIHQEKVE